MTLTGDEVVRRRLRAQRLTGEPFGSVEQAVGALVAVQAQDYGPAKWSLGMRVEGATDEVVERAVTEGVVLRTHVLRPTWHFVLPADIRWLLTATAPRIRARDAGRCRQLGLAEATFAASARLLRKALRGGEALTRTEAATVVKRGGVDVTGQRLPYLLMHAELDGVVCSGPRRGAQHTYMLLDERAPGSLDLPRDEALARLASRYFTGHGPATDKDLASWASLTLGEVRQAIHAAADELVREDVDGRVFWSAREPVGVAEPSPPEVRLIHTYDEYMMGFSESRALLSRSGSGLPERWTPLVLLDGREAGAWRRTLGREVLVEVESRRPFDASQHRALEAEVARFARYLGRPARLYLTDHGGGE